MEGTKRLTLEALIAKKEQREKDKTSFKEIAVDELGGTLVFKKLPLSKLLELLDMQPDTPSTRESLEFEAELIYRSCPMLQDKQLQAAYDCAEPTDVVYRVLDDNVGAIGELSTQILDFYGMGDAVREEIKNS